MEDLNKWMEDFEEMLDYQNEELIDIINHEYTHTKLRDLSELEEKAA